MRLRIIVEGQRAHVYDGDTGQAVPCRALSLRLRVGQPTVLRLELVDFQAHVDYHTAPAETDEQPTTWAS